MGIHRITKTFAVIWFMELTLMLFITFLDFVDWPFHPFVCLKILLYSAAAGCIYLQARSIRGSGIARVSNLGVLLLNLVVVFVCLLNLLFALAFIASITTLVLASILLILSIFGLMFSFIPYLLEDTLRRKEPPQRKPQHAYHSSEDDDSETDEDEDEDEEAVLGYREYLKIYRSNIQGGPPRTQISGSSSIPRPPHAPPAVEEDDLPPPYETEPSR